MTRLVTLSFALVLCMSLGARAARAEDYAPGLDADYLWDGGALPFVYATTAVALGLRNFGKPADNPTFFLQSEGGEKDVSNTIPEFVVVMYSARFAGAIAASPRARALASSRGLWRGNAAQSILVAPQRAQPGAHSRDSLVRALSLEAVAISLEAVAPIRGS
ncbi:MAG: hypothetical protein GY811_10280 [Myxococcales bacterium]|nr:hypothetical protein [Myxococcales bacterium]